MRKHAATAVPLLALCLALLAICPPSAAVGRTLGVQPSSITVAPGGLASVTLALDDGTGVAGFQVDLGFDPALLAVESCVRGAAIADGGKWGFNYSQPSAGTLRVLAYAQDPQHVALNAGANALVTVGLRAATSPGTSNLTLSGGVLADAIGDPIDVDTASGQVTISGPLTAEAGPDKTIAAGGSTTLEGSATGGTPPYAYAWLPVTGLDDPSSPTPVASPSETTTYTLTVTDDVGATATDTVTVTVGAAPLVVEAGPGKSITIGETVELEGAISGGSQPYTCRWEPALWVSDPGILRPRAKVYETTTFTLTVTDALGATGQDTVTVTVDGTRTVSLPDVSGQAGEEVEAVLGIDYCFRVFAFEVVVGFDPDAKDFVAAVPSENLVAWTINSEMLAPGQVRVTGTGDLGPVDACALVAIRFREKGEPGTTALTLESCVLRDGEVTIPVRTVNGTNTITAGNRPPVLEAVGNRMVAEGDTLTITPEATDPDGDPLTWSALNLPPGAVFDGPSHTFTWTPDYDQAGSYPGVHFEVSDGDLADWEDITITVAHTNRPPRLEGLEDRTVQVGQTVTFQVNGSDPDGDPLTYSAENLPAGAAFDPDTRTFAWSPTADQIGIHSVLFRASDGDLADFEYVTIAVSAAPCGMSITTLHLPTTVHVGHLHPVWVRLFNSGMEACTVTVTLQRAAPTAGLRSAPQTVTVRPGETQKVVFPYRFSQEEMPLVTLCGTACCAHGHTETREETARVAK